MNIYLTILLVIILLLIVYWLYKRYENKKERKQLESLIESIKNHITITLYNINKFTNIPLNMKKIFKRGEIWLADLYSNNSCVINGKRPAIVISNNIANTFSLTVDIIPLSSNTSKILPVHVLIEKEFGLSNDSFALVEQKIVIDKKRLYYKLGSINNKTMDKIEKAILIHLGIKAIKHIDNGELKIVI